MRATNKYLPESSPLLLLHFREFYRQVLEQERKLNESAAPVTVNAVGEDVAPAVAAPEPVGETALATRASSVAVTEPGIRYEGYCPLLVFGVWERKLAFKEKAGGIFAYRAEGWRIAQELRAELERR